MARPRKTSGKSTSFGKRSDAEKSFHNRKKERPSYGDEKPRRSSSAGSKPSRFSKPGGDRKRSDDSSSDRPKRFSKPYGKSEGGEGRPFRKSAGSFGDKPRFSKPFEKRESGEGRPFRKAPGSFDSERPKRFSKPFDKSEGGERPFRKSSGSFGDKPRFSKPFDKKEGGEGRPFRKSSGSFDADKPKRFSKPLDKSEGSERPFHKSAESGDGEKPKRFSKPFEKRDDDRSFKKPGGDFGTRPRKSAEEGEKGGEKRPRTSSNFGKPYAKKPFVKREASKDIPFRKNARFGERTEEDVPKFNRGEDAVKKGPKPRAAEKTGEDADLIRLNKFMANSGVGSRRQADEFIKMGLVTVNGEVVTEMGHKIKLTDEVRYEGKRLKSEKLTYVLLNKPKGFITTTDDPQDRNTVMGLVASAGKERIYPVGRLDRNTTGLLLLTNDGDLADKLTHPSYNVKKIYKVELDKPLTKNDFQKIVEGVYLEEGRAMVDDLAIVSDDSKEVGIELHIGWNRIVRRIFESLGYEVVKLDRVVYAGLDKKELSRGQWRFLKPEEIIKLKHFK